MQKIMSSPDKSRNHSLTSLVRGRRAHIRLDLAEAVADARRVEHDARPERDRLARLVHGRGVRRRLPGRVVREVRHEATVLVDVRVERPLAEDRRRALVPLHGVLLGGRDVVRVRVRGARDDDVRVAADDALRDELRADRVAEPAARHGRQLPRHDQHHEVPDTEHLDVDRARGPLVREVRETGVEEDRLRGLAVDLLLVRDGRDCALDDLPEGVLRGRVVALDEVEGTRSIPAKFVLAWEEKSRR